MPASAAHTISGETRLSSTPREAPLVRDLPLIGSLPDVVREGMIDLLRGAWRTHGDTFRLRLPDTEMLVVVHPAAVEQVLGGHTEQYVKGRSYDLFRLMFGDGLLSLEGNAWRERRRLAQPAFHRERIAGFARTMASITGDAIASWRWRIPEGGVLDMHHEMMRLTLEIVCATLFGQRLGEDGTNASSRAFADALTLISERSNSVQLPLAIPTPGNLRVKRAIRTLDENVHAIIAKAQASDPGSPIRQTLLGMFLDARDEEGNGLDAESLRNETLTMFLAGHETTGLLMTWLFTVLASGDPAGIRLREEVDTVLEGRTPTFEDVPKLVYTRQVIDEVLRMCPPAWAVARDAAFDGTLAGMRVKRGHRVLPAIFLTHRHPEFWEDPDRFEPDRFEASAVKARHRWAYLPFSLGARMCIGNQFSLVEAAIILSMLVQRADFERATHEPIKAQATITMRPAGPVPVRLRWRPTH